MSSKVDIRVEVDPARSEPRVVIQTSEKSEFVENIIYAIERCVETEYPQVPAYEGDALVLINQWDIVRIYSENRRLVICTETGEYESRSTLRDLEGILDRYCFVRISRFEIINLKKASGFDFSVSGTIKVAFEDGTETWVSRRHVRAIKETLDGEQREGVTE
ncbi:MAG: LytTR family transcriptional regulator DNA-binding domain-containing protein [Eubacterium sp.]|nr:LytTR family transcriptional regulator DNA-binding domain-containing protein [Eubacterium sp.]